MARSDGVAILAACVDDIRAGRHSVEECLAAYPQMRGELEPLLSLAQRLAPPSPVEIDPVRKMQARLRFTEALHREQRQPWWQRLWPAPRPRQGWRMMPVVAALALIMVLGTGGGAVFAAAQSAQPDDPLYGLKTAIEQVQVATAFSDDARAEAQLQIAERRLAELTRALETGNEAAAVQTTHAYQIALAQAIKHLAKAEESGKEVGNLQDRVKANQGKEQEILHRANVPDKDRPRDTRDKEQATSPDQTGDQATKQPVAPPAQKPAEQPQQKPQDQGRPDAPGQSKDNGRGQSEGGQPDQPSTQPHDKGNQGRGNAR